MQANPVRLFTVFNRGGLNVYVNLDFKTLLLVAWDAWYEGFGHAHALKLCLIPTLVLHIEVWTTELLDE